jgi:2-O-methyltransferase
MKYTKFISSSYWLSKLFPSKQEGTIPKKDIYAYLPKNPVIVEAGAHIGSDTLEMAKRWKKATIHAFEPVPHLFQILAKNTEGVANIHIYPLALGEVTGEVEIYLSSGKSDASSSVLVPKKHLDIHPDVFFEEKINVPITTLDEWAARYDIKQVDMLWLDLQGFELQVLKNSPSILRWVKVIYTEVNLIENYEKTGLYGELKDWLTGQGFRVEREELPWSDAGNVLFIRNVN